MQTYQEIIKNLANEFQTRLEEKINSKERINNAIKGYLLLKNKSNAQYEMYWYNKARRL